MNGQSDRSLEIKKRITIAVTYTVVGMFWALPAFIVVNSELKILVLLGAAVPALLLIGQLVRVKRESLDISSNWEPDKPGRWAGENRKLWVLLLSTLITIFAAVVLLWILGKTNWIIPVAAVVFSLHFYLLPHDILIWEDLLLASAVVVAAITTPFLAPDQTWLWILIAASACALACWLAADLRYQRALVLQEEERADIDREAYS